ncbi:TPA: hypothetical protein N0F65_005749 [Lagenidium giganteum]|uniref:Integrase catalytic domain-containing protein n=1 Tax=Lagenidium giganteum TaxID=4803 RepID=A0AAV2YWN4_9STRA|nr:TPA: hypothetical protein N0F65_005749 [Lagenidium giganteum]
MQQYVLWAERQAGREFEVPRTSSTACPTDKGGEFTNHEMAAWYQARGIEHVQVRPKRSHLNPCERQQ